MKNMKNNYLASIVSRAHYGPTDRKSLWGLPPNPASAEGKATGGNASWQ